MALDFNKIYENNLFEGNESVSGRGSDLKQTEILREKLVPLLKSMGVKKFLDLPCGDFNWMQHVDFDGIEYIGGDIVGGLVDKNNEKYGQPGRSFERINLMTSNFPSGIDAIFCRDCLVHLSFDEIKAVMNNIKRSDAKWLLTTTFPNHPVNKELTGIWRSLDLCSAPLNFPQPVWLLNENCTEGGNAWSDKSIGVWEISKL